MDEPDDDIEIEVEDADGVDDVETGDEPDEPDQPAFMDADDDDAYCDGDPDLDEVDWEQVEYLEARQQEALALPEEERPMAMLGLLHEMYGDDLEVL